MSQDQGRQLCLGEDISTVRNPQRVVYRTRAVTIDMSVFDHELSGEGRSISNAHRKHQHLDF